MNDAPETTMVRVGEHQWMSDAEARAKGYKPLHDEPRPQPSAQFKPSIGDYIFEGILLVIIIIVGTCFTQWLHPIIAKGVHALLH